MTQAEREEGRGQRAKETTLPLNGEGRPKTLNREPKDTQLAEAKEALLAVRWSEDQLCWGVGLFLLMILLGLLV